ncbi:MAG: hypothetical protein AB8H47_29930 [Bacteroidia bacterium]
MKRLFIFLFPLLSLIACREVVKPDLCEAVIRDSQRYQNDASDGFQLIEAKLEGDCLIITVSYGGGCGEVDFTLLAIEGETFSLPPQIPMRLILDDNDNCEALVSEELQFDLSLLQNEGGNGLHMLDLEGVDEMIEYQY